MLTGRCYPGGGEIFHGPDPGVEVILAVSVADLFAHVVPKRFGLPLNDVSTEQGSSGDEISRFDDDHVDSEAFHLQTQAIGDGLDAIFGQTVSRASDGTHATQLRRNVHHSAASLTDQRQHGFSDANDAEQVRLGNLRQFKNFMK